MLLIRVIHWTYAIHKHSSWFRIWQIRVGLMLDILKEMKDQERHLWTWNKTFLTKVNNKKNAHTYFSISCFMSRHFYRNIKRQAINIQFLGFTKVFPLSFVCSLPVNVVSIFSGWLNIEHRWRSTDFLFCELLDKKLGLLKIRANQIWSN